MQGAHFALPGAEVVQPAKNRCRVAVQRHWLGASNQFESCGFIRSRDDEEWPNLQYHFLPIAISYNGKSAVQAHGFQAHVGSMRSASRGRIRLTSKDPHAAPSILFNYMAKEKDWEEFRDAIRLTREIIAQPAFDRYRGREISPGPDVQSDEEFPTISSSSTPKLFITPAAAAAWAKVTWR